MYAITVLTSPSTLKVFTGLDAIYYKLHSTRWQQSRYRTLHYQNFAAVSTPKATNRLCRQYLAFQSGQLKRYVSRFCPTTKADSRVSNQTRPGEGHYLSNLPQSLSHYTE